MCPVSVAFCVLRSFQSFLWLSLHHFRDGDVSPLRTILLHSLYDIRWYPLNLTRVLMVHGVLYPCNVAGERLTWSRKNHHPVFVFEFSHYLLGDLGQTENWLSGFFTANYSRRIPSPGYTSNSASSSKLQRYISKLRKFPTRLYTFPTHAYIPENMRYPYSIYVLTIWEYINLENGTATLVYYLPFFGPIEIHYLNI